MRFDASTPWRTLVKALDHDLETREKGGPASREDSLAWQEVSRRVHVYARAVVRTRAGFDEHDAEDLAGGLIAKLQDRRLVRRMVRVGVPAGYFYAMLRNAANDLWRRRRFEQTPLTEGLVSEVLEGATRAGARRSALAEALRAELAQLTEEERYLLHMRFDRRLKLQDIASELGVGFSAVAVRLHRLIRKLKSRLGAES